MIKYVGPLTVADKIKTDRERREKIKKQFECTKAKIQKIREHDSTREIEYPQYKESYDYVDNLFPNLNIKKIKIFKASPKLLNKLGFGGAGGLYTLIYKTVIITRSVPNKNRYKYQVKAKISKDEVIVHELLHYCYFEEGQMSRSTEMKEEFAYGWSIGYLRSKGYSDEKIIKNNFLPFLYMGVRDKIFESILAANKITAVQYNYFSRKKKERTLRRYIRRVHTKSLATAMEKGYKLIGVYNQKLEETNPFQGKRDKKINQWDLIDLE